jgi:DNA-dependent RNA polymerase auxiliary subunit epsilon
MQLLQEGKVNIEKIKELENKIKEYEKENKQ